MFATYVVVFTTKNSKYYFYNDVCLGVTDRETGELKLEHPAMGQRMVGSAGQELTSFVTAEARVGTRIVFSNDTITSYVVSVTILGATNKEELSHDAFLRQQLAEAKNHEELRRTR
jgi:hypothetical protein